MLFRSGAHRLSGIPAVLINGRLDISGPPDVAWNLAQSWSDAQLVLADDAGHGSAQPSTFAAILSATAHFQIRR